MSKPLTLEFLQSEAAKYQTRGEFQKRSPSAYVVARRRGILDSICEHMHSPYKRDWTFSDLENEALKFTTRTTFAKEASAAYQAAQSRGILETICSHMTFDKLPTWTEEALTEEASKYSSRHEFIDGSNSAYRAAQRRGILDKICKHMTGLYKHHYWLDAEIRDAALHFKTRTAFQRGAAKAYKAAYERGIIDDVCAHMPPPTSGFNRDASAILYYLRIDSVWAGTLYKIGITNSSVEMRFRDERTKYTVLETWHYDKGRDAAQEEALIIKKYRQYLYKGEDRILNAGGNTELFIIDILELDRP